MGNYLSHFGAFARRLSSTNRAKFYRRVFVPVVSVSGSISLRMRRLRSLS